MRMLFDVGFEFGWIAVRVRADSEPRGLATAKESSAIPSMNLAEQRILLLCHEDTA